MRLYQNRSIVERGTDPFVWWEMNKDTYPHLYTVARRYLAIPATSVPSERLFSKAAQIVVQRLNRLTGKHVQMLLFLGSLGCKNIVPYFVMVWVVGCKWVTWTVVVERNYGSDRLVLQGGTNASTLRRSVAPCSVS